MKINELERQTKQKLYDLFGKQKTKEILRLSKENLSQEEIDLFFRKINNLNGDYIELQFSRPHELHYKVYAQEKIKEVGLIYNNFRYTMNPNLF